MSYILTEKGKHFVEWYGTVGNIKVKSDMTITAPVECQPRDNLGSYDICVAVGELTDAQLRCLINEGYIIRI